MALYFLVISKLKKAKLRGEASHGMVCALQELGIDGKLVSKEYADGIFIFPSDAEVGADALEILNLHDEVLELGLTPNRADCLNMLGVAYEVVAIYGREVKLPAIDLQETAEKNCRLHFCKCRSERRKSIIHCKNGEERKNWSITNVDANSPYGDWHSSD